MAESDRSAGHHLLETLPFKYNGDDNCRNNYNRSLSSLNGGPGPRPAREKCNKVIFILVVLLILLLNVAGIGFATLSLQSEATQSTPTCSSATYLFDCYPEGGANEISCRSRGCCWNSSASPSCFYPDGFGYAMNGALSEESYGHSATLSRKANQPIQYREPAATLRVDVYLETQYRLRVKVCTNITVPAWICADTHMEKLPIHRRTFSTFFQIVF